MMKKILNMLFILMLVFISVFYCLKTIEASASASGVVINEIMIGQDGAVKNEFIELFNNSDLDIDLSGYTLKKKTSSGAESNLVSASKFQGTIPARGFFLIAHPDYASAISADLPYSGASYSISANNTIILYDDSENEVDKVGYGEAADFEGAPAINPENNYSIERNPPGLDADNNFDDFKTCSKPSPGSAPSEENDPEPIIICGDGIINDGSSLIGAGPEECDDGNTVSGDGCDSLCLIEEAEEEQEEAEEEPEEPEEEHEEEESAGDQAAATSTPETDSDNIETRHGGPKYRLGDILINEIVSDPADEEVEWIELFNNTNSEINLDNWYITEGSGAKTILKGVIDASGADMFFIIEKPKGSLNNKGDLIILKTDTGALIDQIAYGEWDDGNISNNAPAAGDPYSIARKIDGYNSFNNLYDFAITTTPTKGAGNIITPVQDETDGEISSDEKKLYDFSEDIAISEIYPNPAGSDDPEEPERGEFIELYNTGEKSINLTGWSLGDETTKKYKIGNSKKDPGGPLENLEPGGYLVIYRAESKIALNNTSDSVKLYQPLKDEPLLTVKYENAKEGWSFNSGILEGENCNSRLQECLRKNWQWSETPTPGEPNRVNVINHPPIVDFDCPDTALIARPVFFDSSDTIDEDGGALNFYWDFGDGFTNTLPSPEHTFFTAGSYTVKLSVSDEENKADEEKIITIIRSADFTDNIDVLGWEQGSGEVIISEFMPNPEGADADGEYIELYNKGEARINLYNWRLDDSEGGSKPYTIIDSIWLDSGGRLTISRDESGLALNNSLDSVRLFNDNSELIDEVAYEKSFEGEAYARGENDKWFWTTTPTPNEENIIRISDSSYASPVSAGAAKKQEKTEEKIIITTTPELARNLDPGDLVKISGTVAVKPGILGTQYFYIVGSPGIQVYNYKKDFPGLSVGDYVEISGELAISAGEWRVKTKTAEDIDLIERRDPPLPINIDCDKITEDTVGSLITVAGEVVEKKGSSIFLDDNTDEIKIYIRSAAGINTKSIKEGDKIAATGILNQTKSGLRLMPRSSDDIIKKDIETAEAGRVLGEVAANDEWEVAARDKKLELFKYLLIISATVIAVLFGLLFKLSRDGNK